jgi:NADP-dependent 3-hydroxy acid dehydrogenase YdfG
VNPKGQGGTIVQISSIGGCLTVPGHSFYHARLVTYPQLPSVVSILR